MYRPIPSLPGVYHHDATRPPNFTPPARVPQTIVWRASLSSCLFYPNRGAPKRAEHESRAHAGPRRLRRRTRCSSTTRRGAPADRRGTPRPCATRPPSTGGTTGRHPAPGGGWCARTSVRVWSARARACDAALVARAKSILGFWGALYSTSIIGLVYGRPEVRRTFAQWALGSRSLRIWLCSPA